MFEEAASSPRSAEPQAVEPGADDALLAPDEPPPFEVVNPDGGAQVLLICDHASRRLPRSCAGLGLDETQLRRHIAWDIGAAEV
ncbi:MAG: N-formylglutamate amidohydrolase, partial [Alphaproteobacteria bacterium]